MDRLFDRLGDMLRTVLGEGAGSATRRARSGRPPHGRPGHADDPDLAAAWDELEDYLKSGDAEPAPGAGSASSGARDRATHPREPLRADYATLGVPFDAPMSDVKRAYKRMMQAHHPDRFAHDPKRQADATRKAARINDAFARIEQAARGS